jgi:DNA-binding transcriptional regulator YiaG
LTHLQWPAYGGGVIGQSTIDAALDRSRQRRRLPPPAARRSIRDLAGLVLGDIAQELGVSIAAVSRWETGDRYPRDPALLERYLALLERLAREGLGQ